MQNVYASKVKHDRISTVIMTACQGRIKSGSNDENESLNPNIMSHV